MRRFASVPTTLGTAMPPLLNTKLTTTPGSTWVPAIIDWEITLPDGTVTLYCSVIAPTASCAPVSAADAALCVCPTTLGTAMPPLLTTKLTAAPGSTWVPDVTDW